MLLLIIILLIIPVFIDPNNINDSNKSHRDNEDDICNDDNNVDEEEDNEGDGNGDDNGNCNGNRDGDGNDDRSGHNSGIDGYTGRNNNISIGNCEIGGFDDNCSVDANTSTNTNTHSQMTPNYKRES